VEHLRIAALWPESDPGPSEYEVESQTALQLCAESIRFKRTFIILVSALLIPYYKRSYDGNIDSFLIYSSHLFLFLFLFLCLFLSVFNYSKRQRTIP
jgi:hypothetical protein